MKKTVVAQHFLLNYNDHVLTIFLPRAYTGAAAGQGVAGEGGAGGQVLLQQWECHNQPPPCPFHNTAYLVL